jgi:hypothetical protein
MAWHGNLYKSAPIPPKHVGAQTLAHAQAFLPFTYDIMPFEKIPFPYFSISYKQSTNYNAKILSRLNGFIRNTYISYILLDDNLI